MSNILLQIAKCNQIASASQLQKRNLNPMEFLGDNSSWNLPINLQKFDAKKKTDRDSCKLRNKQDKQTTIIKRVSFKSFEFFASQNL